MKRVLVAVLALVFLQCVPEDGIDGLNGQDGIDGINGTNGQDGNDGVSIGLESNALGNGCRELIFFKDSNNNGVKDSSESVVSSFEICDGISPNIKLITEESESCANGGTVFIFFDDINDDGVIDSKESILGTETICNGLDGQNGTSVSLFIEEASLTDCPSGGLLITVFIDADGDSEYDADTESIVTQTVACYPNSESLVNEVTKDIRSNWNEVFTTVPGEDYRLEITANVSWGTYCPSLAYDPAYILPGFYGVSVPTKTENNARCDDAIYSSIFCEYPGLRPTPDIYDAENHSYSYYFTGYANQINVGFFDNLLGDNCGSVTFKLFKNSSSISENFTKLGSLNGHEYYYLKQESTFNQAKQIAKSLGAELLSITTQEEQEFIYNSLSEAGLESNNWWLGLTDEENEGNWKWLSQEEFSYSNWSPGEPNGSTSENYAHLEGPNCKWNDFPSSGTPNNSPIYLIIEL